jgi:hypothetical protein
VQKYNFCIPPETTFRSTDYPSEGSHVRLMKETSSGKHKITIPNHNPVAKGTLSDILEKVSPGCQIPKDEIAEPP